MIVRETRQQTDTDRGSRQTKTEAGDRQRQSDQLTGVGQGQGPETQVGGGVRDTAQAELNGVDGLVNEHLPKLKLPQHRKQTSSLLVRTAAADKTDISTCPQSLILLYAEYTKCSKPVLMIW